MTAGALGSGLVGGTFAPSLFLGATAGAAYQEILQVTRPCRESVKRFISYASSDLSLSSTLAYSSSRLYQCSLTYSGFPRDISVL